MSRLAIAWVVVVGLTVMYLAVEDLAVAAIVLALVKLRIILREFMDVRHGPRVLRAATDVLVGVMGVSLIATYLVGRALS